ncbi:MAG: hypothetical protein KJO44_08805 [Gemmatimonadetes bacterium]|nr:hypothetical protein [Gemmatimonadota bacterium]
MILESTHRPLTPAEQRLLGARIRDLESRVARGPAVLIPGVVVIAILWTATLLLSDASWWIVSSFWIVVGGGILLWVRRDLKKDLAGLRIVLAECESACRRNEAEDFRIEATAFAEFEEVEDEGACYAFEIDGRRLVFVSGQQFYPQARFPSLDFSLVHLLNERGEPVDGVIAKRGPAVSADLVIPAIVKRGLEIPEHLEVLDGTIHQIEEVLER